MKEILTATSSVATSIGSGSGGADSTLIWGTLAIVGVGALIVVGYLIFQQLKK